MLTELVDYDYYIFNYEGSSMPESSFKKHSIKASNKVNYYTSKRINENNIDDNIRNTVCEIIDLLIYQEQLKKEVLNNDIEKSSETVGPHSVSYVNKTSIKDKHIMSSDELDRECYKICYINLVNTGLLYRGAS